MKLTRSSIKSSANRGFVPSTQGGHQVQGLALNLFETALNKISLSVFAIPYSKPSFEGYKEQYKDFFFYRFNNTTYAWKRRVTDQSLPRNFKQEEIHIDEHAPVFRKIVEESLVEYFYQKKYKVRKVKYSSNWEVALKREQSVGFGHLSLFPTLVFSVTNLYSILSNKQVIALAVSKRYVPRFTGSEAEINLQHIDTRDWNRNIRGDIVASSKNRRLYLEATGQSDRYWQFLDSKESDKSEYEYLQNTWNSFNEIRNDLFLPAGLKVTNFIYSNLPNASFEASAINKPQYYFYNEKTKSGQYYDQVLTDLRPFSYDLFASKRIKILEAVS